MTGASQEDGSRLSLALDRRHWLRGLGATIVGAGLGLPASPSAAASSTGSVLNVQDYGAVGNGETDDRQAIQDTIDDATDGDTVVFPATDDAYLVREDPNDDRHCIALNDEHADDLTLTGEGPGTVVKAGDLDTGDNTCAIFRFYTAGNLFYRDGFGTLDVTLQHMVIDGNYPENDLRESDGISGCVRIDNSVETITGNDLTFRDLRMTRSTSTAWSVRSHDAGHGTDKVTVERCEVIDTQAGHGFSPGSATATINDESDIVNTLTSIKSIDTGGLDGNPGNGININGTVLIEGAYFEGNFGGNKLSNGGIYPTLRNARFNEVNGNTSLRETVPQSANDGEYLFTVEDIVIQNSDIAGIRLGDKGPYEGWVFGEVAILNVNRNGDERAFGITSDAEFTMDTLHVCDTPGDAVRTWSWNESATIETINHSNVGGEIVNDDTNNLTVNEINEQPCPDLDVVTEDEVGAWANVTQETNFSVAIQSTETTVLLGDALTLRVAVENTGDLIGFQDITLTIDGTVVAETNVLLDGGEERTVTMSWPTSAGEVGNHTATVSSADTSDTVDIEVEDRAAFTLDEVRVPDQFASGGELEAAITVTNIGGESGEDDIRLSVADEEIDVETLHLNAEDSAEITLSWPTSTDAVGEWAVTISTSIDAIDRTVTIVEPPVFDVEIVGTNAPIEVGTDLRVDTSVRNTGNIVSEQEIGLETFGEIVDTHSIEVPEGNSTEVTLTWTPGEADLGERTVTVFAPDVTDDVTVEIVERGTFEVEISSMNTPVEPGEALSVDATVTNLGEIDSERKIRLEIDGVEIDTIIVPVAAESSETVPFSWTPEADNVGEFEVSVRSDEASAARTIQVGDTDAYDSADDSLPGFGLGGAIAGIGGVAYMLKQRIGEAPDDEL